MQDKPIFPAEFPGSSTPQLEGAPRSRSHDRRPQPPKPESKEVTDHS